MPALGEVVEQDLLARQLVADLERERIHEKEEVEVLGCRSGERENTWGRFQICSCRSTERERETMRGRSGERKIWRRFKFRQRSAESENTRGSWSQVLEEEKMNFFTKILERPTFCLNSCSSSLVNESAFAIRGIRFTCIQVQWWALTNDEN